MTTEPPAWLDELSLGAGPPWLQMGVRALDLDRWLIADSARDQELALKARLLAERPAEVFAALPDTEGPSRETLDLVLGWLADHGVDHPPARTDLHPLDAAGRLVQEDLCLMVEGPSGVVLAAASLCFPSHWRLADKLGRPTATIHGPVPHYAEELEARVDTFLSRLRADRPVWRRNLSVHCHADLFRPEPHESPESFSGGIDGVWLRSEYQTLRRLARTGAIVFTIKTQVCPAAVLADRPDLAHALATKLARSALDLEARGETVPFPAWFPDWLSTR